MSCYPRVSQIFSTGALLAVSFTSVPNAYSRRSNASDIPVVRWQAGDSASTFSVTDNGKYRYSLKNGDVEISVAIDSQELEKARHRPLPIFGLLVHVHYSGEKSLDLSPEHISLEFVRHYQVVTSSLDPDDLSNRIQNDADNLSDEVEHEVRRHPETKTKQESVLQAHLKDMTDLMGFISLHCLRSSILDSGNTEAEGWLFFSTKNKWIGGWKQQEEFILRIPVHGRVFEFPFALPPHKGDVFLRRRDQ